LKLFVVAVVSLSDAIGSGESLLELVPWQRSMRRLVVRVALFPVALPRVFFELLAEIFEVKPAFMRICVLIHVGAQKLSQRVGHDSLVGRDQVCALLAVPLAEE
jgi:hypothetical protein